MGTVVVGLGGRVYTWTSTKHSIFFNLVCEEYLNLIRKRRRRLIEDSWTRSVSNDTIRYVFDFLSVWLIYLIDLRNIVR